MRPHPSTLSDDKRATREEERNDEDEKKATATAT
jgi:hypothetical protein